MQIQQLMGRDLHCGVQGRGRREEHDRRTWDGDIQEEGTQGREVGGQVRRDGKPGKSGVIKVDRRVTGVEEGGRAR